MSRITCKTLIEDAKRAGYDVRAMSNRTRIDNGKLAIFVYESGTIHRADTQLHLCSRMRVTDAYYLMFPNAKFDE